MWRPAERIEPEQLCLNASGWRGQRPEDTSEWTGQYNSGDEDRTTEHALEQPAIATREWSPQIWVQETAESNQRLEIQTTE